MRRFVRKLIRKLIRTVVKAFVLAGALFLILGCCTKEEIPPIESPSDIVTGITQVIAPSSNSTQETTTDSDFVIIGDEAPIYEPIDDSITSGDYVVTYVPEYSGDLWVTLNNNVPNFNVSDFDKEFEIYSDLDYLGRCGVAYANISTLTMPTQEREDISMIYPTGWEQTKLGEDYYLYNRCHLIAFCLAGENANELNLITGTSTFNQEGMWYFESQVQNYCYETGNSVLYRVTPIYTGENLLADGVQIEALSEDGSLSFNVFIYNVEPNVTINYATGENYVEEQ